MDEPANSAAVPEKRRRRPPLACVACRRRKVRCDRKLPCQNCVRARRATSCTYVPDDRLEPREGMPFHEGDLRGSSPQRSDGHGGLVSPTSSTAAARGCSSTQQEGAPGPEASGSGAGSYAGPQDAAALGKRIRQLEQQLQQVVDSKKSGTAGSKPGKTFSTKQPAGARILEDEHWSIDDGTHTAHFMQSKTGQEAGPHVMLAKSRYLGSSHWMHGVTLFPRTNTLMMFLESLKTNKNSEIYQNIAHCKMLGRSIKATRLPQHQSLSIGQHIPSRELADQLVDGYMRTCEKLYRILHVPSFRQEYERYWQNPQGAREAFIIQLQLVMAIGAVLYDDKYSLRRSVVRWVYEARFWLLQPSEKSRINLSGLQVWCLVHMARDICGVGSDLVWASAGTLMRMALYTGVHRDPDHLPKMSLLAAETRRRLWATILEILVMSSMESGGPPLISMDDFDTKPPGNYNDEDLVNTLDPSQTPDPKPRATFTDSSVQLALLDSIKVRLDIATYLNQFRSVPTYDRTLVLNADLTAASRNLDALLRIFQTQEPSISPFQLCCAEHIIQRYFLALHFSWVGSSKNDPRYFFSRKMCVEIAVRNQKEGALHGFLGHKNDGPPPDDFGRLLICASGGFRYIGTQCLLVLILELLWELEENREAIRAVRGGGADTSTPALTPASGLPNASPASSVGSSRLPQASSTPGMGVSLLSSIGSNSSGAYGNDMFDVLRRATKWMRARIIAGEVNIKGYLFGCGMLAEAEALQRGLSDEDVLAEVEQAAGHAAADALNILKEMHAEIMGQLSNAGVGGQPGSGADMQVGPMPGPPSMPPATNAPGGSGRLGEPRYTGMEGVQMPMPMPGMSTQGQRYGPMDAGGGNVMTDWDWDVLQDPNYNFNLNLNLGAMDVIFGNEI